MFTPESGGPAETVGIPTVETCTVQLLQTAGLDQWSHSQRRRSTKRCRHITLNGKQFVDRGGGGFNPLCHRGR